MWLVSQARQKIINGTFRSWKNEIVSLLKTRL